MARKKLNSKTSQFLYDRYIAGDVKREEVYEEEVINTEIARRTYHLRTNLGLSQQELARLEDADFDGHGD